MLAFLVATAMSFGNASHHPSLPPIVRTCLKQVPAVTLDWSQHPVFLKVFFTLSTDLEYVIAVREGNHSRTLVCTSAGKATVLGSSLSQHPFSTMPGDDYMSSSWRVCKKKEVYDFRKYYPDVPTPANEAVCFLWEDGEALIYSDGRQLHWKSFKP
jgi:hypothetical protein